MHIRAISGSLLVVLLAGCGNSFYSPTRDRENVIRHERVASNLEERAGRLQGRNASLRQREDLLAGKLRGVRQEIEDLRRVPGPEDRTADHERLQSLLSEERSLRGKLEEVREALQTEERRQNVLRRTEVR